MRPAKKLLAAATTAINVVFSRQEKKSIYFATSALLHSSIIKAEFVKFSASSSTPGFSNNFFYSCVLGVSIALAFSTMLTFISVIYGCPPPLALLDL
jgi:hypothetical protein